MTSATTRTYRIVWKLEGINGTRARLATEVINATSNKTVCHTAAERTTTSRIQFIDDLNNTKVSLNWIDTFWFNKTTGKYETYFQGLEFSSSSFPSNVQAKFLFGNFTLSKDETACFDPTTTTFGSEDSLDGYIYKYAEGEYPPSQETHVVTGNQYITVGQIFIPDRPPYPYYKYRGYISFNTTSIPSLAYNISATLKLKTYSRPDTDFTLKVIGGQQAICGDSLDVDDWNAGNLIITTWNTVNYPGDHIYVNLPISSDQINKAGRTQFRLVSNRDEENIEPDGYEHIMFYSGNSTNNEPKLEVTYYVDTRIINGVTWFYRNVGGNKIAIVLFGARIAWVPPYHFVDIMSIEICKTVYTQRFLDALVQNGFSILTVKEDQILFYGWENGTYYDENSTWVQDATVWLKNQGYEHAFLFGHSGGGVVVANEIQKDYATFFSAAVVAAAPVNFDIWSNNTIFQSAHTASKAKVCTSFLAPESDGWIQPPTRLQMNVYYNNMLVQKDWHNWWGGHGVFPETCQDHPGETVSTAVLNWYNAPHPPSTPFTPSGAKTGYVYTSYSYSSGTIDPNGDNVKYQFRWGDGSTTTTGSYPSGVNITRSHAWTRPGTYNVSVRAQDTGELWSNWSPNLTITTTQNDAGSGGDAGNSFVGATSISPGLYQAYTGTLYQSNPTDTQDWYQFYAQSGQTIYVGMWPPSGVDFDLQLYNPAGSLKAGSYMGAGCKDSVSYTADSTGYWRTKIYIQSGEGQYSFEVSVGWGGGDPGCPILYVYNGSEYVCEGLLNIHNPEGIDVITNHTLASMPRRVYGTYLFRLIEHPCTHSYIDQVKLYAILEDKTLIQLPLIWAWHSEYGNVLPQLLFSDDWRTETLGANHNNGTSQNINLRFLALPPSIKIVGFIFQIEGYNPELK